jgi:hypothetical protein
MMRKFVLFLGSVTLAVVWSFALHADCYNTCHCTYCLEVDGSPSDIKYRVLNEQACCREFRHNEDTHKREGDTSFTGDLRKVVNANPNCNDWGGLNRRTATACMMDVDQNVTHMTCRTYCEADD